MALEEVELTVYPDDCDAFGHLNQAAFLALFERARWEVLARGPGMDYWTREGMSPVVRKTTVEYHAAAFPGDVIRFGLVLVHLGRTSYTLRQTARRVKDEALLATAELVFVCVDGEGRPVPVPESFAQIMADRPSSGTLRRIAVNGVSLAVEIRGRGPAILFIHGYPLDHTIWGAQMAGLEGWTRIAPDLRGMGQSDAPDLGYSMATYAEDLLALLTTLGVDRAVLCGLSMGGYVAFEMLRRAPERVRALVLMDTRAEADSPEAKKARDAAMVQARDGGAAAIADAMLPKLLARGAAPDLVLRVQELMAHTPVAGILGALSAMRDRPDSSALLPALAQVHSLVVVGEQDQVTPRESAQAIVDALPRGRLVVLPGAGHLTPLEQPEAVSRALAEFLGTLADGA